MKKKELTVLDYERLRVAWRDSDFEQRDLVPLFWVKRAFEVDPVVLLPAKPNYRGRLTGITLRSNADL